MRMEGWAVHVLIILNHVSYDVFFPEGFLCFGSFRQLHRIGDTCIESDDLENAFGCSSSWDTAIFRRTNRFGAVSYPVCQCMPL